MEPNLTLEFPLLDPKPEPLIVTVALPPAGTVPPPVKVSVTLDRCGLTLKVTELDFPIPVFTVTFTERDVPEGILHFICVSDQEV